MNSKNNKIQAKLFDVSQKNANFATSNQNRGQNAAEPYRLAIFVPSPYRNNHTTTPCRESGNRPGVSAILDLTARSVVSFCQNQNRMNPTVHLGHVQPAILSMVGRIAKNCKETMGNLRKVSAKWLQTPSVTFTRICGESVTRRDVLVTALGVCAGLLIIIVASWLEGGAL